MVRNSKIFNKSYEALKANFSVWAALSFLSIFIITLILQVNFEFTEVILSNGNQLYSDLVANQNYGFAVPFAPVITALVLSFLGWVLFLYIILSLYSALAVTTLKSKSKSKFDKKSILSICGISLLIGLIISLILRTSFALLFLFYSCLVYTLIILFFLVRGNRLAYLVHLKSIHKRVLSLELLYFLAVLLLLGIKVIFVKIGLYAVSRLIFEGVDLVILLVFLHLFFHNITSDKILKSKFKKSSKLIWSKQKILVSLIFVGVLALTWGLFYILNLIPYTEYLIKLIFALEFSFGTVYLLKVFSEENK